LKKFSLISIGYGTSSLLAYVFYFLFAKILSLEEFGELIYIFSITAVVVIFARFGLGTTITVQLAKGNLKFLTQATTLHLISIVVISVILYFIHPLLFILTLGSAFFMMDLNILQGKRDYKKYLIIAISVRVSQIILSLIFYNLMGLNGIFLATGIVSILHSWHYIKSLFTWNFKFDQIKKHFHSIIQNFGVESAQILPNWTDKLLLVPLIGF